MAANHDKKLPLTKEEKQVQDTITSVFLRIYWMILGYIPFLVGAKFILKNKQDLFSIGDIILIATTFLVLIARFVDIKFFKGETKDGAPATMKDFSFYSIILIVVTIALWLSLHFINL
jgi:hypothetical protein